MNWLPDMDLNHDKQIQSLLCYRYTIGQWRAPRRIGLSTGPSSGEAPVAPCGAHSGTAPGSQLERRSLTRPDRATFSTCRVGDRRSGGCKTRPSFIDRFVPGRSPALQLLRNT